MKKGIRSIGSMGFTDIWVSMAIVGIMIEAAMSPSQDLIDASRLGTAARQVLSHMRA